MKETRLGVMTHYSGYYLAPNAACDRLVGTRPSKCSRRDLVGFSRKVAEAGGVVTWEAPVERDGTLARPFRDQLAAVGRALLSRGVAPDAR